VGARGSTRIPRWGLLAAALLALATAAALFESLTGSRSAVAPAARTHAVARPSLLSLPLAVQGPASSTLGAASAAYRVSADRVGFRAASPAQHLSSSFSSAGVSVTSGAARLELKLRAIGYGSSLAPLGDVAPAASANRVLYRRAGLSEWYANGPLGLEQGFTLARAPAGEGAGPLTLAMTLSGNTHPSLARGGHRLALVRAGKTVLRYSGLTATDARGDLLPSWLELEGGRLLLRVDARGARYPLRIDPFVHQGIKLTPAGESGGGSFGASVAMTPDGNTAVIAGFGGGWMFTRSGETWTQQGGKFTPSEGPQPISSLALSADGNTAVLGSATANSSRGEAWVFTRSGETWTQQGETLTGSGAADKAEFGTSVALSADGNTALVGARRDHAQVGGAYVFTRSGEMWTQQGGRITPAGEAGEGRFGEGVALSADGNMAMIGAGYENKLGAVWVFTRSGETWTQGEKLTGGGESISETVFDPVGFFGASIALSEDASTALIGAKGAFGNAGGAWVFTRTGETWTQQAALRGSHELTSETKPGYFGASVALSADGNAALAGGPGNGGFGSAWAFTRSGETWSQQGGNLGSGEKATSGFGQGVALSGDGNTALIGNPGNGTTGAAWVFPPAQPAEPPEFGRCAKTLRGAEGAFSSSGCTAPKIGSLEWLQGVGAKPKFTTKITEGVATLETVKGSKVVCGTENGIGEYSRRKTVGGVVLTFAGCERLGEPCTSAGSTSGEIITNALEGIVGIEKLGATAKENKTGIDLFPAGHTGPLMEFSCGATEVALRGSVIVPVPPNKMLLTHALKYVGAKGKQKPEKFVGGEKDVLEASFDKGTYEQVGLTVKMTESNEEAIEINTVF
jgi:hypothetical protein